MYRKKPEDKLSMWNITIKIDGKKIEPSSHVKYLGILINSFLNWNFHIDDLSTKLSCAVGMLAKIRHYINKKTLSMVYHGIFFIPTSIWAYGVVVSMFDIHFSVRGSNPGCGGKMS